ncbi:MAG: lysylphosphatidylglycerol synthase transmembrane domain-containing protein [Planctomycetota bacterium]
MKESPKKLAIHFAKIVASVVILGFLYNKANSDPSFENFWDTPKSWFWISLALAACFSAFFCSFIRWKIMVSALDIDFSIRDAIRIGFIGQLFNVVAFGVIGGDSLRAFYVTRHVKNRIPAAIASVIADRVVGLLTMFGIASTAFLYLSYRGPEFTGQEGMRTLNYIGQFVVICSGIGFLGMLALFVSPTLSEMGWYKKLQKIPKLGTVLKTLTEIALMYRKRPKALAVSFLLSVGVNIAFLLTIFFMAMGLNVSHPTFANHFIIEPIAMVGNAAPLPGGVGGMEAAMSFLYESFGSSSGVIVAFAFRFAILSVSAVGAVFWFANRTQMQSVMKASKVTKMSAA